MLFIVSSTEKTGHGLFILIQRRSCIDWCTKLRVRSHVCRFVRALVRHRHSRVHLAAQDHKSILTYSIATRRMYLQRTQKQAQILHTHTAKIRSVHLRVGFSRNMFTHTSMKPQQRIALHATCDTHNVVIVRIVCDRPFVLLTNVRLLCERMRAFSHIADNGRRCCRRCPCCRCRTTQTQTRRATQRPQYISPGWLSV